MTDRDFEELVDNFRQLGQRLSQQIRRDPDLASSIRQFASSLIKITEGPAIPPATGGFAPRVKEPYGTATGYMAPPMRQPVAEPRFSEFEGEFYRPGVEPAGGAWGGGEPPMTSEQARRAFGPDTIDLNLISERARLKAEGVRWAWTRERRIHAGADFRREIQPNDQSLVHRAKNLANCFMWMNDPFGPRLTDQHQMETLAGCFDTLAESVALVKEVMPDRHKQPDLVKQALTYMAQSQSALRMVVRQIYDRDDQDQMEAYQWLRRITQVERIYLSRYMRLDDPAEPSDWIMIHEAVTRIEQQLDESRRASAEIKKLTRKLAYETSQIVHLPADLAKPKWETLFEIVGEMLQYGMPASHPDLINPLLHVANSRPADVEVPELIAPVWSQVEAAVEDRKRSAEVEEGEESGTRPIPETTGMRSLATGFRAPRPAEPAEPEEMDITSQVQERLKGRSIVLVSGEAREPARRALETTLGVKQLIWYTLHGPEDTANLKPLLVNPEVILVLVAPKAAERAREELSELCEKVKKPMVRLSIGYAPSAVTNAIVNQAGEQILATIERPLSPAKSPFSTSSLRPGMGLRRPSSFGQNLDFDEED
jgi:hypothetical protein